MTTSTTTSTPTDAETPLDLDRWLSQPQQTALRYAALYESVADLRPSLTLDDLVRLRDYLDTLIADTPSTTESTSGESETVRSAAECVCPRVRSGEVEYEPCVRAVEWGCRCHRPCHCPVCRAEDTRAATAYQKRFFAS